jgi:WD40 repeat protein
VMRAMDTDLGRVVAVKQLLHREEVAEQRFLREALVTARLEHPGIVPVHEAGRGEDGTPYYAMKLVAGQPLAELIDQRPTLVDRLKLVENIVAVADAVAYAHSNGIIHRDLKPANVVVGDYGETVVIDWGLAKEISPGGEEPAGGAPPAPRGISLASHVAHPGDVLRQLTSAGHVLGTPAYMAPEQAGGKDVDERADVYSLGAMLYHVVAGRPPYDDERVDTSDDLVLRVLAGAPVDLRLLEPACPVDLAAIVTKAMERAPRDRYATAGELAEDLRRHQSGQQVRAHAYTAGQILARWVRRHRYVVLVAALSAVAMTGLSAFGVKRIVRERDVAVAAEERASDRADELLLQQAEALLAVDPTRAAALARSYPPAGADQMWAARVVADARSRGVSAHVLDGHQRPVYALAWASSARLLVQDMTSLHLWTLPVESHEVLDALGEDYLATSEGAGVAAYVREDSQLVVRRSGTTHVLGEVQGILWDIQLSADGSRVATATSTGMVTLWSVDRGLGWRRERPAGVYQGLRFSPDGSLLASCGRDGKLALWEAETGSVRFNGTCDGLANVDFQFSSDGAHLVIGSRTGHLTTLNIKELSTTTRAVLSGAVAFIRTAEGARVVVASPAGEVLKIDCRTGERLFTAHVTSTVTQLAYDATADRTFVGSSGGTISVLGALGKANGVLRGHEGPVRALAIAPGGAMLASGGEDTKVRIWSLAFEAPRVTQLADAPLFHSRFSPDGALVAAEGQDGTVSVCDTRRFECQTSVAHRSLAFGLLWSRDSQYLATAGWDGRVRVWERRSGTAEYIDGSANASRVELSGIFGDPLRVVTVSPDKGPQVWTRAEGRWSAEPLRDGAPWLVSSPDGNAVAGATARREVTVWMNEEPGLVPRRRVPFADADLHAVREVSRSGRYVIAAMADGKARLVDAELMTSRAFDDASEREFVLDPSERFAVAGGGDGAVTWVDLATGEEFEHRPYRTKVVSVAFVDNLLVAASRDGAIWVLNVSSREQCMLHLDTQSVRDAALSGRGGLVAAATDDGQLHLVRLSNCHWSRSTSLPRN